MKNEMTCREARALVDVVDDDARPDSVALRRHLALCDDCAAEAPELAWLLTLPSESAPTPTFRPVLRISGIAAAAVFLMAVAIGWGGGRDAEDPRVATLNVGVVLNADGPVGEAIEGLTSRTVHAVHETGGASRMTFEMTSEPTPRLQRSEIEWIR